MAANILHMLMLVGRLLNYKDKDIQHATNVPRLALSSSTAEYCVCVVSVWLPTQNIHATFELQGLLNDILRLLGNISHQALHGGGVDILDNHLYLFGDCLDLN